eukprot:3626499-Rhodomonas_salina.1
MGERGEGAGEKERGREERERREREEREKRERSEREEREREAREREREKARATWGGRKDRGRGREVCSDVRLVRMGEWGCVCTRARCTVLRGGGEVQRSGCVCTRARSAVLFVVLRSELRLYQVAVLHHYCGNPPPRQQARGVRKGTLAKSNAIRLNLSTICTREAVARICSGLCLRRT